MEKENLKSNQYVLKLEWKCKDKFLDLDMTSFLLNKNKSLGILEDFVYYNNLESCDKSIVHFGDSRLLLDELKVEEIKIDLSKTSERIEEIIFFISINDYTKKEDKFFGNLEFCKVSFIEVGSNIKLLEYDLVDYLSVYSCMEVLKLKVKDNSVVYSGLGLDNSLYDLCNKYGVAMKR